MSDCVGNWTPEDLKISRVVGILDMDAFEVQIYLKLLYPNQDEWVDIYNKNPVVLTVEGTSRIFALNHNAKRKGVTRLQKVSEAQALIPHLIVLTKKNKFNKPETRNIRRTSRLIYEKILEFKMLQGMKFNLEYASSDEFYFDLSKDVDDIFRRCEHLSLKRQSIGHNTYFVGADKTLKNGRILQLLKNQRNISEHRLIVGATIMERISLFIYEETDCLNSSCGVSCNKLLAKLAVAANKPEGITILPKWSLKRFSKTLKVSSIPGLQRDKGKEVIEKAQAYLDTDDEIYMFDLQQMSFRELMRCLKCKAEEVRWVFDLVNGKCALPVVMKSRNNSVSSCRTVRNLSAGNYSGVGNLLGNLVLDLIDKLIDDKEWNHREANQISATFRINYRSKEYSDTVIVDEFDYEESKTILPKLTSSYRNIYEKLDKNLRGNGFLARVELKATF